MQLITVLLYPLEELVGVQELQLKLNTSEEEKRIIKEQLKMAQVSRHETQQNSFQFINRKQLKLKSSSLKKK